MKKVIYIIAVLVALGAIYFTLMNNKKEMAATAAIAEQRSDAIPVVLTEAQNSRIDKSFAVNGTFTPIQSLSLTSETQGQVIRLNKRKGESVRAGEVMAQVEDNVLRANLITAQASFEKTKRDLERFENLAAGEAITKRQLEDIRLASQNAQAQLIMARQQLNKAAIKAPISGIINETYIEVGTVLSPGAKLFDIVNVERLKLNTKVSEREVLLIKKGDKVKVSADVNSDQTYEGTVTAIGASANNALKYDVEVEVQNAAENTLKAGMYGTARFDVADTRDALLVAREAIVGSLQNPQVYVVKDQTASLKPVTVGTVANDKVEITGGLTPGEQVVLSGQINLKEGSKVRVL